MPLWLCRPAPKRRRAARVGSRGAADAARAIRCFRGSASTRAVLHPVDADRLLHEVGLIPLEIDQFARPYLAPEGDQDRGGISVTVAAVLTGNCHSHSKARPPPTARPRGVQDEFVLGAIAQNLRRLAKLAHAPPLATPGFA